MAGAESLVYTSSLKEIEGDLTTCCGIIPFLTKYLLEYDSVVRVGILTAALLTGSGRLMILLAVNFTKKVARFDLLGRDWCREILAN